MAYDPGDPWQEDLEEALDNSSCVVVFLGPNGIGRWQNEEMRAAIDDRVSKEAQLMPTSYPELDKLAQMMTDNPTIAIQLEGHTDNVGDRYKNIKLSQDRVGVVKEYLVSRGVEAYRITGVGYGGGQTNS